MNLVDFIEIAKDMPISSVLKIRLHKPNSTVGKVVLDIDSIFIDGKIIYLTSEKEML